jgi:hypothetical protein
VERLKLMFCWSIRRSSKLAMESQNSELAQENSQMVQVSSMGS